MAFVKKEVKRKFAILQKIKSNLLTIKTLSF